MMKRNLRKKNLIKPALQFKITLAFMATSASLMCLMAFLVILFLTDEGGGKFGVSDQVLDQVIPVLTRSFIITMVLLVPVTLVVGVLATFMVAGPLRCFERFLERVRDGEKPADCSIRKGDELGEFCELLNEVTRPLREEPGAEAVPSGKGDLTDAA